MNDPTQHPAQRAMRPTAAAEGAEIIDIPAAAVSAIDLVHDRHCSRGILE